MGNAMEQEVCGAVTEEVIRKVAGSNPPRGHR